MKLLGRLLLFAVGGVLLYLSITSIIAGVKDIQIEGIEAFFQKDTWNAILKVAIQVFYALCGAYSIFIGLRGKSTFLSFIAAIILVAIVVYRTMEFVKSGAEINFQNIFNLILNYLMPIGFSIGVLLLTFGRNKDSN